MADFPELSLLPVVLTLAGYQFGLFLQKKLRTPLASPILIAVVLMLLFLTCTGMPTQTYLKGTAVISWLMAPATVCLAIPMYEQLQVLRKNLPAVLTGVACGAVSSLVMIALFCLALGFDRSLTVTVLPKSVTAAIGVPLSELSGGMAPVTTIAILITGILANIAGSACCRLFRIRGAVAQGVAFGTAGHVIGTAKASELSPLAGAVSSLSLVVAGLLTSVLFPLAVGLLPH